jgi:hypothetical protein
MLRHPLRLARREAIVELVKPSDCMKAEYPSAEGIRTRLKGREVALALAPGESVLGFYTVGVLLERPADGGAVSARLKVPSMPTGTRRFHVWIIHQHYTFLNKETGESVERPLWIIFTDVFAHKEGNDWFIEWLCGWADKGDKTHWEGIVAITGIAVGVRDEQQQSAGR